MTSAGEPTTPPCAVCSFHLWKQVAHLPHSTLGLYSDARFPGRSILQLDPHYEHLEEVPAAILSSYMTSLQTAVGTLRTVTGAARINVSFLGNSVAHLHAHLIPRWPAREALPGKSPWNDPRPPTPLAPAEEAALLKKLQAAFR